MLKVTDIANKIAGELIAVNRDFTVGKDYSTKHFEYGDAVYSDPPRVCRNKDYDLFLPPNREQRYLFKQLDNMQ